MMLSNECDQLLVAAKPSLPLQTKGALICDQRSPSAYQMWANSASKSED